MRESAPSTAPAFPQPIVVYSEGSTGSVDGGNLAVDELYPNQDGIGEELRSALRLLSIAIQRVDEAIQCEAEGDLVGSDQARDRLSVILPQIFQVRALNDSLGAIVNAVQSALENLSPKPWTVSQIDAIKKALSTIRSYPFLSFEDAVELVTSLEDTGLDVHPTGYRILTDWLDVEGVR